MCLSLAVEHQFGSVYPGRLQMLSLPACCTMDVSWAITKVWDLSTCWRPWFTISLAPSISAVNMGAMSGTRSLISAGSSYTRSSTLTLPI